MPRIRIDGLPWGSSKECSVEGCSRPHLARGFCKAHYRREIDGVKTSEFWMIPEGQKKCSVCESIKPFEDFKSDSRYRYGVKSECFDCRKTWEVSRNFGESGLALLSKMRAGEGCLTCGSLEDLTIDHDHRCCPKPPTCGTCTRHILCRSCNLIEGQAKGSSTRLRAIADYIDRYEQHLTT